MLGVTRPADARVLWAGAVAAVLTDIAIRSGVAGQAGAALVFVAAAALVTSGRLANRQSVALVATSTLFGVWLAVRTSDWLLPIDILAAGGLLVLGASLSGGGSVLDLPFPTAVTRALHAMAHGLAAPAFVAAPVRHGRSAAVCGASLWPFPFSSAWGCCWDRPTPCSPASSSGGRRARSSPTVCS